MMSGMTDGSNMKERVKSACILFLLLILITMYAWQLEEKEEGAKSGEGVETGSEGILSENPIDTFFEKAKAENLSFITQREFANIYLDSWERELSNAYQVLNEKSEQISDYPAGYIRESMEAYIKYAEAEGWMEAYYRNESTKNEDFYSDYIYAKAHRIREQTLRIYALVEDAVEVTDFGGESQFVFDKEETAVFFLRYGMKDEK